MRNSKPDMYFHPPGAPSRWGVLDIGLRCQHSCRSCYYSFLDGSDDQFAGMRRAKNHSVDWLKRQVRALKANGFIGFDITGGEPTSHPGLVEIVQEATDVGLATRVITLSQFMDKRDLLGRLLSAGVTDFLMSYHAPDEQSFREYSGASLAKMEAAMDVLDERGFQYCTNTVLTEMTFRRLPELAKKISKRSVYAANMINMNSYYEWSLKDRSAGVQAKYEEVYPYLLEARDILEEVGIAVNVRYAPTCSMRGMERNLVGITGVRYDAHEWMNRQNHHATDDDSPEEMAERFEMRPRSTPGADLFVQEAQVGEVPIIAYRGSRGAPSKIFPKSCAGCAAFQTCDGVDAIYVQRNGSSEFIPYTGPSRGSFLDRDRLNHKPVFAVKLQPWADVRSAIQEHCAK